MKKLSLAIVLGSVATLSWLALAPSAADAEGTACARAKFDTKMTEDACKKGGQEEAKKVWKAWVVEAKKTDATMSCKGCHSKLAPDYPVTTDGLDKYKKLGGK